MHSALETRIGFDMRPYKEYIDNEILVTMAQMDKPSKIFDFLYLVSDSLPSETSFYQHDEKPSFFFCQ